MAKKNTEVVKFKNTSDNYTRHSDNEIAKAIAMYDVEQNISAVARQFKVPFSTAARWIKNREKYLGKVEDGTAVVAREIYELQKDHLISTNIELQTMALDQVKKKIGEANALQAATIYGILHDKLSKSVGENVGTGNTMNIMLNGMDSEQAAVIMERVVGRMNNSDSNK